MTIFAPIGLASDRVMAALVSGLELEFGRGAGEALAARFMEAEDIDIRWNAGMQERWIGTYYSEEEMPELDRVAATGLLDGKWFVAIFIVDGEGQAHGMLSCRGFPNQMAAERGLAQMR